VPTAVELQTEYGDAIQVILVESQNAEDEDMLAFALKHKWLGNRAIWTSERPFSTGGSGLPSYALLGPDGAVLLIGNSANDHSKIKDAIEEMVKKGSSAPKGTPESVAKLYRELDKGNYAKVVTEAQKAAVKAAGKDPAVEKAARALETAAGAKLDREIARVKALAGQGRYSAAQQASEALGKGAKGHHDFEAKAAELGKLFEGPEVQQEVAAERELERLAAELFVDGAKDAKAAKKLRKFAETNSGTKAGERAATLAALAEKAAVLRA
jgi:hypothetical protein